MWLDLAVANLPVAVQYTAKLLKISQYDAAN